MQLINKKCHKQNRRPNKCELFMASDTTWETSLVTSLHIARWLRAFSEFLDAWAFAPRNLTLASKTWTLAAGHDQAVVPHGQGSITINWNLITTNVHLIA